jgi:hypothetical protein
MKPTALVVSLLIAAPGGYTYGQTWDCRPAFSIDRSVLITVALEPQTRASQISVLAPGVVYDAEYEVRGFDRWWGFRDSEPDGRSYAFAIQPDGTGIYHVSHEGVGPESFVPQQFYACEERGTDRTRSSQTEQRAIQGQVEQRTRAERELVEQAEARPRAEEDARRVEEERLARLRAEEEERQRQLEAQRRRQEDEQRRREGEERQRREAELARQRTQSERELQRMLAAEEERRQAEQPGQRDQYIALLQAHIERNWSPPASARAGLECIVHLTQIPSGDVVDVRVGRCNGDDAVVRSIEAAVYRASPLPRAPTQALFSRNIEFVIRPDLR